MIAYMCMIAYILTGMHIYGDNNGVPGVCMHIQLYRQTVHAHLYIPISTIHSRLEIQAHAHIHMFTSTYTHVHTYIHIYQPLPAVCALLAAPQTWSTRAVMVDASIFENLGCG
jgi:hypothetical protein